VEKYFLFKKQNPKVKPNDVSQHVVSCAAGEGLRCAHLQMFTGVSVGPVSRVSYKQAEYGLKQAEMLSFPLKLSNTTNSTTMISLTVNQS